MLTKEKLLAYRMQVASEPSDSLAHTLLMELEGFFGLVTRSEEQRFLNYLTSDENLTQDEAQKVLHKHSLTGLVEYESGECRKCNGKGFVDISECMGVRSEECPRCGGSGQRNRVKIPYGDSYG